MTVTLDAKQLENVFYHPLFVMGIMIVKMAVMKKTVVSVQSFIQYSSTAY